MAWLVVAALGGVVGCSGSSGLLVTAADDVSATAARPSQSSVPVRRFDRPKEFAAAGVELPRGLSARSLAFGEPTGRVLFDSTLYAANGAGGLQSLDLAPGGATQVFTHPDLAQTPNGTQMAGALSGSPALTDIGGRPMVAFPQILQLPGRGTTAGRTVLAVTAVDPATHGVAWSASVPMDGEIGTPTVLGVRGTTLVLAVTDQHGQSSAVCALDTTTRTLRWSKPGFLGRALVGDTVVTVQPQDETNMRQTVTGLAIADGAPAWSLPGSLYQTSITSAGPGFAAIEGRDYGRGRSTFRLLDAAGKDVIPPSQATSGYATYGMRCAWDQKTVTVCTGVGIVLALDAASGKELWRLPDQAANRVAPEVTAVWHGAVYGQVSSRPVVLDGATGRDLTTPAVAPVQVSATTVIAVDSTGTLRAYPATG
ncbi:PQQ-binding-like beta-propeller repeat protein [Yinghuangia aomiensis]|uniref:PQQ-binding-like beta-propeller repeat protein n=1 Tax=Yinghuangia aomiensis TaxID=676205 RepID=A0ABP9H395_9ACTN